jgi:glycosyltransferase involved in cell wall biosynthesis
MKYKKTKYIYWFAYYNLSSPSVRYRAQYPLNYATNKLNIKSKIIIPGYHPRRLLKFILAYISSIVTSSNESLIVIQRVQSNFIYSTLLKILISIKKSNSIYDIDDADYLEQDSTSIHYFAKNCTFVSAGSLELVKYLKQFNLKTLHITSPTVDINILKKEKEKVFTIGWIGGFNWGHKDSLFKYVFPSVKNLKFKCKLILMGVDKEEHENEIKNYFSNSKYVDLEITKNINWENEKELQNRIKLFDIGIATLSNTPYQIAKSGIKAKQYINNGVPVLCNNLPENSNIVINNYNGFVCNTALDFEKKIIYFKEMSEKTYLNYSKNAKSSSVNFNHKKYFEDINKLINL